MNSLRGTLFKGVVLGTALVLSAAGLALYFSVRAHVVDEMDRSLSDKARLLIQSVEEKNYGLEVDLEEMRVRDMAESDAPEYLHVGSLGGRVIFRTGGLEGVDILSLVEPSLVEEHNWHSLPDGRRLRSVLVAFVPQRDEEDENLVPDTDDTIVVDTKGSPGEIVLFQLFRDTAGLDRFLASFLIMLLGTGLGSLGILSFMIWTVISRGSGPINDLAARIGEIRDEDLGVRIGENTVFKELRPVVSRLNHLLGRLESSFAREKGFTSDAAHELRTPLAGLKTTIEVALGREREGTEYRKALQKSLEMVLQLEHLVAGLLSLARLEAGQETGKPTRVSVDSCVRTVWEEYGQAAVEKGVNVSLDLGNGGEGDNGFTALMDREFFVQVLEELFKNALYYVDPGGSIRVRLDTNDRPARLQIRNTGSAVDGEDAEKVFDRFWRGISTREDTGTRFGLGLPIARMVVQTMGGGVEVDTESGGEFVVTVVLPEGN
ncbi:MAG: ATP-binding protein [bacterium]|nr:ATP-binding protein [bacterium]